LRGAGVSEVIINLHHHGDQIAAWVEAQPNLGLRVAYSREQDLLDTGGGLKQAAWFFSGAEPFLVHNVDVLSDVDLGSVVQAHNASGALATLVAMQRPTMRPLIFGADGQLVGRVGARGESLVRDAAEPRQLLGFCGIQVISPALFPRLSETGAFSIIDAYLRLAAEGASIRAFRADGSRWRDCGRPEHLRPL